MESYTVNDFSKFIKCKKDLYNAAKRNGWFLPSLKSSIIKEAYLLGVVEGSIYCPKFQDINLKPCPSAPNKSILMKKFKDALVQNGLTTNGYDSASLPDKRWIVDVLGHLIPDDEIFNKDYVAPPRKNKTEEYKTISLPPTFL